MRGLIISPLAVNVNAGPRVYVHTGSCTHKQRRRRVSGVTHRALKLEKCVCERKKARRLAVTPALLWDRYVVKILLLLSAKVREESPPFHTTSSLGHGALEIRTIANLLWCSHSTALSLPSVFISADQCVCLMLLPSKWFKTVTGMLE